MAINRKCPKCGGEHVQLSNERSKHGCFWFLIFGVYYIILLMFKWIIGMCFFVCYDWWMAIVKKISGKGHVWQCKKWFSGNKKIYYCHDCGFNFKA